MLFAWMLYLVTWGDAELEREREREDRGGGGERDRIREKRRGDRKRGEERKFGGEYLDIISSLLLREEPKFKGASS